MYKTVLGIIMAVLGLNIFIFFMFRQKDRREKTEATLSRNYEIVQKWELPEILEELSGIELIDSKRMACIQDEKGIIFIYNLKDSLIERRIPFAGNGDYEGITTWNNSAFILRSDGTIFEVQDFLASPPGEVVKYDTPLKDDQDVEGLCADDKNLRLLMLIKEKGLKKDSRNLYAFDLSQRSFRKKPLQNLDLGAPKLEELAKKPEKRFRPSEIEIHPLSGEYYLLDAESPKLMIADINLSPIHIYPFNQKNFNQPEGLSFGPNGELYISNEAGDEAANILKIELQNQEQ